MCNSVLPSGIQRNMLFVIEHLEPKVSEWLRIEYTHASRIVGRRRLMITNVQRAGDFKKLKNIAMVERKRAGELFSQEELIVLDPRAKKRISSRDLRGRRAMVIGGILGDEPPLGRTRELLTKTLPKALARNLGKGQLAIDGAIYVAKEISDGKPLEQIPMQFGLEIKISEVHSTSLPYAFPLVGSRPLISPELVEYLKHA